MPPYEGILHHEEGIDLIPSNIELSGLEVTLVNTMSRENVLKEYLKTIDSQYDSRIISVSAVHNESEMDFEQRYLDETLHIMSALALAEVERIEDATEYDVVDYMV